MSGRRIPLVLGMAMLVRSVPRPALAHGGPGSCSVAGSLALFGTGTLLGLVLFPPLEEKSRHVPFA